MKEAELGLLAIEPPPREDPLIFSPVLAFKAEEDRDHLYHPRHEVPENFNQPLLKMGPRQISNEPEEDRDHLYHKVA
ncbi:Hypothetical predicted protein [Pelobates cultripes]|uniref:Uncharacterized protein n=1 Tax=Pelobates cultripes TaxID=61616 RepID=A0AAD1TEL6_PELCU|nr:Hypothetical predicted protein [Pelobates cultripes]